ncbi:MAG: Beta-barrel assembly machine subunit BamF [Roseibaca calidilacus]|uniref:Beta-barrel assembly machine subunit BamF n=1 Tax=Roseibaca calidilacus TaxID=1666912 RepID=A0A0N8K855_9RHOB|nr:DUF3035 domain-containing protein [Roseibaca calidilacus]KPP93593.1 MAG: Beta-barrel assembly machine subunit BamF [Roseibaca calidilacus]CUX80400.1 Beta-barrel assembly machine subunit BamF [Roseibaca calidilacus]
MALRHGILAIAGCAVLALGACSDTDQPILMHAAAQDREPDEFGILPTKPLEMPDSLADLPAPNPGGANRVDPQPRADVARALGGNPARAMAGGGVDGGIVNYAARFGRSDGIRDQLAAEDLQFRRDNDGRLLERLFSVNVYHNAYEGMWLDKYAELQRWRRAGVQTPSAPPEGQQAE